MDIMQELLLFNVIKQVFLKHTRREREREHGRRRVNSEKGKLRGKGK